MTFAPHRVEWNREKVARYWDHLPQARTAQTYFSQQVGEHLISLLESESMLNSVTEVLDYGCGPGYLLEKLCEKNYPCSGVDYSQTSITLAEQRLKDSTPLNHLSKISSIPTDLPDQHYSHLISTETVEHLLDEGLEQVFKEWYRVLKPGGKLILTTPNREDLSLSEQLCPDCGCLFHEWQHIHSWSSETLSHYGQAQGFKTEKVITLNLRPHSALRPLKMLGDTLLKRRRGNLIYIATKPKLS